MSIPSKENSSFRGFGKHMRANLKGKPFTALATTEAVKCFCTFKALKCHQSVNLVADLGIDSKSAGAANAHRAAWDIGDCFVVQYSCGLSFGHDGRTTYAAIRRLKQEPGLRQEMGTPAGTVAERRFALSCSRKRWNANIQSVCTRPGTRAQKRPARSEPIP